MYPGGSWIEQVLLSVAVGEAVDSIIFFAFSYLSHNANFGHHTMYDIVVGSGISFR